MSYNHHNLHHQDDNKPDSRMKLKIDEKSQLNQPGPSLRNSSNEKENSTSSEANQTGNNSATRNASKRTASPNTDDSLVDFKSPKLSAKPYPIRNPVKLVSDKPRAKATRGRKRLNDTSRTLKSKKSTEINQPSIESSFFKPPTVDPSFICPLCLKSFSDAGTQSIHSKNCAAKNNISTKKLLAAAQLQERQAEERLAIGLPAGAFQQPKKKSFNLKKMIPEGDPDIHLALALSESLREMQEKEEFDEAIALAAETDEKLLGMSSSQRKSTLQSFGFVTNKPIIDVTEKPKKRKHLGPTVLQTRSQETRERLLSEKIAQILVGTESITQAKLEEKQFSHVDTLILQSNVLKNIHRPQQELWRYSSVKKKRSNYYVKDLCSFISPVDEPETEFSDTEEIQRLNTEVKSPEMMDFQSNVHLESHNLKNSDVDTEFSNSLALNWSKMVNSTACSDVLILLKDNKCLYSHWVVLWTRCQSIVKDFLPNEDPEAQQRHKVSWIDINYSGALVFMEFVYCGRVIDPKVLEDHNLVEEVQYLAKKYGLKEFLDYLDKKRLEMSQKSTKQPENENLSLLRPSTSPLEAPKHTQLVVEISEDEENTSELLKLSEKSFSPQCNRISVSPDLFADMDSFYETSVVPQTNKNDSEEALDVLVELVNNENSIESPKKIISPQYSSQINEKSLSIDVTEALELKVTPNRTLRRSLTCPEALIGRKSSEKVIKSDLSLFIEKIQSENAKDLLGLDSESESPLEPLPKRRRNPFKVKQDHDESSLWANYHLKGSKDEFNVKSAAREEKKSALSLLEDEIRAKAAENPSKFVPFPNECNHSSDIELTEDPKDEQFKENEEKRNNRPLESPNKSLSFSSSFSVLSNFDTDEENESMYTKYMKTHKRNSIGDYRSILNGLMKQNPTEIETKSSENVSHKHEISTINKQRLAELSAFDVYDSMAPSPLETSQEDISKSQKSIEMSSRPGSPIDLTQLSDDDDGALELISPTQRSREGGKIAEELQEIVGVKSFDLDPDEELDFGDWSSERSGDRNYPLTQSARQRSRNNSPQVEDEGKEKSFQLEKELNSVDLTQTDEEEAAEDCLAIVRPSQTITENVTRILRDCGILETTFDEELKEKNVRKTLNSSPIFLSSGSEAGDAHGDVHGVADGPGVNNDDGWNGNALNDDFESNFQDFVIEGGAESPSRAFWTDCQEPSTSRQSINCDNVTFRRRKSPEEPQKNSRSPVHSISSNSDDDFPSFSSMKINSQPERRSSVSPLKKNDSRLLKVKSKSEGNFSVRGKSLKVKKTSDLSSGPLKLNKIFNYLNLTPSQAEISFNVESQEDYSTLSSPELNKRLADYGLRNQKRHRAVQLLDYIYNQLHPRVPEDLLPSEAHLTELNEAINEDNEKYSLKPSQGHEATDFNGPVSLEEDSESGGESSDCEKSFASEIAEEMELSGEEYEEKDVVLVQESFKKLLEDDRQLYNKVLLYEPLSLESLHAKLKERGIKSGPKVLADYLDDECITFFIEHPKKGGIRSGTRRKKKTINNK